MTVSSPTHFATTRGFRQFYLATSFNLFTSFAFLGRLTDQHLKSRLQDGQVIPDN